MNPSSPQTAVPDSAADRCECDSFDVIQFWIEPPSSEMSAAFFDHLRHCRGCLQKWITLEAAADMAGLFQPEPADPATGSISTQEF